jgi:putative peptide modification system cyclase
MADPASIDRDRQSASTAVARLRAVLVCDLVDSTALVERLGDAGGAELIRRHDRAARELLLRHGGREIDKTDGFLLLFERPIEAVGFALDYQRALQALSRDTGQVLRARVGIHVGEVLLWNNPAEAIAAGAKPVDVEGLAKAIAARLMGVARPGQILLSETAHALAERARSELRSEPGQVRWLAHGRYRIKGVAASVPLFEVGEVAIAPLAPPDSGLKARRIAPWWRAWWLQAAALLLLASIPIAMLLRPQPAIAFVERDWVVVASLRNLTDYPLFDSALDTALRIGLEQSRHVNILSELKVRDALQRMQRPPDEPIDRQIGSELALREGAKAVVVPTIAEVGGRIRMSLEVVEPASGVTVYSRTAEAAGRNDVMTAVDRVLVGVRTDLGEPLGTIDGSSRPLEQVTTPDIEALRAFSLGLRARAEGRPLDAMEFFEQAVKRDPGFSMAYLRMAMIMLSHDIEAATRYFELAVEHRARLTDRESLLLDASVALFDSPDHMLQKWKLLAGMYPDEHRAYYNYSYFAHFEAQRYRDAAEFIEPALVPSNPLLGRAHQMQGAAQLASNRIESALAAFVRAESLGVDTALDQIMAHAALRNHTEVERRLDAIPPSGLGYQRVQELLPKVSIRLDQGDWSGALAALAALTSQTEGQPRAARSSAALLGLSMRSYAPDEALVDETRALAAALLESLSRAGALERRRIGFDVLASGWILARAGDAAAARRKLAAAEALIGPDGRPANIDMGLILQAELDLLDGNPASAIARLQPRVSAGNELYFLRAALMRAHAANGDFAQALDAALWLSTQRGRALAEFNNGYVWQLANLVESNLALLAAAEFSERLGRAEQAESHRQDFDRVWPDGATLAAATRRMRELGAGKD